MKIIWDLLLVPNSIAIAFGIIIVIFFTFLKYHFLNNLPPGPLGLPIFGYLPWLFGKPAHFEIEKLHKKYGPLISLYIGNRLVVVLGTTQLMQEAYLTQGDVFSGKPRDSPMEIDGDEKGISICHGSLWKEQRRFVLKTLKDFGVGKQILEPEIKEEIKQFLQMLRETEGKPFCLHKTMGTSIANNICMLEFGKRFGYDDPLFKHMKQQLDELTFSLEIIPLTMYFPWLKRIPFINRFTGQAYKRKLKKELYKFAEQFLQQHEKNFHSEEHRDIIYAWLDERTDKMERYKMEGHFTRDSLQFNLVSLFMAGTETTNSTLLTAIAYMVKNPKIQEECRKEINGIVERSRLPSIADKEYLPYTEATLLEVQRLAVVNPLNLVHSTIADTNLCGYYIPKDTIIMSNIYSIHHDPNVWTEPMKFSPDRFLNKDGQVINKEKIIPFSIGKRMCLGSSLAKMEIFLYFTAMLQNFTFESPSGEQLDLKYCGGVVRRPDYFCVCIKPV